MKLIISLHYSLQKIFGIKTLLFFCLLAIRLQQVDAQQITPEPFPTGIIDYGANGVVVDSLLYLEYHDNNSLKIVKHNGSTYTVIPNPVGYSSWGLEGAIAYNSKMVASFRNASSIAFLGICDGNSTTIIPNPVGYELFLNQWYSPFVVNGALYLFYRDNMGTITLAKYDGNTLTIIPNPSGYNCNKFLTTIGNDIFLEYSNYYVSILAKYDGNTLTTIPNPSGYVKNSSNLNQPIWNDLIKINNNLYLRYTDNNYNAVIAKYDGTNLNIIPNPSGYDGTNAGYWGSPILMNNTLYFRFKGNDGNFDLAKYENNTITIIPSPTGYNVSGVGCTSKKPKVIGNNLYLHYTKNNGNYELAKYDGTTLTIIPSPMGFENGYWDEQFTTIIGNTLFMKYADSEFACFLAKYDGTTLTIIPNPIDGIRDFNRFNCGFIDIAAKVGNTLFMKFQSWETGSFLVKYDGNNYTVYDNPESFESFGFNLVVEGLINYGSQTFFYKSNLYLKLVANDFVNHLAKLSIPCTTPTAYALTGGGSYCAGGTGVTVGLDNSQSGITYQLKKDNVDVGTAVNGTGSAISFGNQTAAGTYTVVATNSTGGCTAMMTGSATVTINPSVTPTISIAANPSGAITTGTNITFTATISNGGATPQYQWYKNNNAIGTNATTYSNNTLANGDVIKCTLTSNAACASPTTVTSADITMSVTIPVVSNIRYVKTVATGTGDGTSWANASSNIQAMLNASSSGGEVWVAAGTYKPTSYPTGCVGCVNSRDYTFFVKDGVKLYGGFSGTETALSQRNITTNVTTLSGDIGVAGDSTDNVYHVLLSVGTIGITIDGFSITRGTASNFDNFSLAIKISGKNINRENGGGINIYGGTNIVSNNRFYNNLAQTNAGAMGIGEGTFILNNNVFYNNSAQSDGGAIAVWEGAFTLTNNIFYNNLAGGSGGSIHNQDGEFIITNNLLYNNNAGDSGGAINSVSTIGNAILTNNTFYQNTVNKFYGGAVLVFNEEGILKNNVFWANNASDEAGGIDYYGSASVTYSLTQLNSIFSNGTGILNNQNPLFVNPLDPDGPDNVFFTADDGFRLQVGSPALNSGTATDAPATDILGAVRPQGTGIDMGAYEGAVGTSCTTPTAYVLTGGGAYCSGGAGVAVGLSNSQNGMTYQLKKDNADAGTAVNGTGAAISFGNQTAAGTYTVVATNTTGGCTATMTESAVITTNPSVTPTINISANPSGTITTGTNVTFTTTISNGGAAPVYQWYKNNNIVGTNADTYSDNALANGDVIKCTLTSNAACASPTTVTSADITMSVTIPVVSNIRYVKTVATGTGDGTSWANASNNIQAMLNASSSGGEVWVAAGTYKPTSYPTGCTSCNSNRDFTFFIKDGVKLYGGFSGTENTLAQRNFSTNITTLSGDIGTVGDNTDNVYHVVSSAGTIGVTIDGFTITGGNANPDANNIVTVNGLQLPSRTNGGGINLLGNDNNSIYTIANNTISGNWASGEGGGISIYLSSLCSITNNILFDNSAEAKGGGIYIQEGSLVLSNNLLYNNNANESGGAIGYAQFTSGSNTSLVINNTFFSNHVNISFGGAIRLEGETAVTLKNNIVWENTAFDNVGGVDIFGEGVVTYCLTQENSSFSTGIGILNNQDPLFVNPLDPDGPDNVFFTADDGFRLQVGSPALNSGTATDAPATDILGAVRPQGTGIDMGAYEGAVGTSCTTPTAYALTGGGAYCTGGTGVAVGLSNSQNGMTYQLKKDNADAGTAVNGTGAAISFGNQTAGTYTVVATNTTGGCTATMTGSAVITVNAVPTTDITVSNNCGNSVLNLTTTGTSFLWSNGATTEDITISTSGIYSVTVTSGVTCTATASQTAAPKTMPMANAGTDVTLSCANTSAVLIATGGVSYVWNNGVTQGSSVSPTVTTTYTVTVAAANGCTATDNIIVTPNPNVCISAALSGTQLACANAIANLTVNVNGGAAPYTVVLNNGTADITVSNYTSGANIAVTNATTRTYILVSIKDNANIMGTVSGSALVTIDNIAPTFTNAPAELTVSQDSIPSFGSYYFTATDNVGAVTISYLNQNQINLTKPNCYNTYYRLIRIYQAADACSNTATATQSILVADQALLTCPSDKTFNTNNDGVNNYNCSTVLRSSDNIAPIYSDLCNNSSLSYALTGATIATGSGAATGLIFNKGITQVRYTSTIPGSTIQRGCVFNVTILDKELPKITTVTQNILDACDLPSPLPNSFNPTTTDNCSGTVNLEVVSDITANVAGCSSKTATLKYTKSLTRTWKVTDASGNTVTKTQLIYIRDMVAPTAVAKTLVVLIGNTNVNLLASEFNLNSSDNCTPSANLQYRACLGATCTNFNSTTVLSKSQIPTGQNQVILPVSFQVWDACSNKSTTVQTSVTLKRATTLDAEQNGSLELPQVSDNETVKPVETSTVDASHGSLKCYPNPFSEDLNLEFNLTQDVERLTLKVYDNQGRLVETNERGEALAGYYQMRWNLADLAAGLYHVCLELDGKCVKMERVIMLK